MAASATLIAPCGPPGQDAPTAAEVARTYRYHLAYTALTGVAAGILTNAPAIGVKALRAADWQIAMPKSLSGIGLVMSLFLGLWMARRPKMPFILVPGLLSCGAVAVMVGSADPWWFLFLLGLVNLFDTVTRPAMTAVIRANYPAESRGLVTGKLRRWSAVTFLAAALATARLLDRDSTWGGVQAVIATAALLQTLAYLAWARVRVRPDEAGSGDEAPADWRALVRETASDLRRDARFQRYLCGCFLFSLSSLMYEPIVLAYFSNELGLNYTQCVLLVDVIPSICSVLTIRRLGAWLDRTNPLLAWAWIRVGWGLDPMLLALAPVWPAGAIWIVVVARLLRGGVMGGSYILWWQLGTNYFAGRREQTSVYIGSHLSLNGIQRMLGPGLGAALVALLTRRELLALGGALVLLSALHARRQAEAETVDGRYPTFADKESADLRPHPPLSTSRASGG